MKKVGDTCDPVIVCRFSDGELGPDEHAQMMEHIGVCSACQKALRENEKLSSLFKGNLEEELSGVKFRPFEERIMDQIRAKKVPWWTGMLDLLAPKKLLVPATMAAAMLVLFFSLMRPPGPIAGPSAIINSYSGENSSVVIFETPKSRQTIIWLNKA